MRQSLSHWIEKHMVFIGGICLAKVTSLVTSSSRETYFSGHISLHIFFLYFCSWQCKESGKSSEIARLLRTYATFPPKGEKDIVGRTEWWGKGSKTNVVDSHRENVQYAIVLIIHRSVRWKTSQNLCLYQMPNGICKPTTEDWDLPAWKDWFSSRSCSRSRYSFVPLASHCGQRLCVLFGCCCLYISWTACMTHSSPLFRLAYT